MIRRSRRDHSRGRDGIEWHILVVHPILAWMGFLIASEPDFVGLPLLHHLALHHADEFGHRSASSVTVIYSPTIAAAVLTMENECAPAESPVRRY
jgi:hypothetical protein